MAGCTWPLDRIAFAGWSYRNRTANPASRENARRVRLQDTARYSIRSGFGVRIAGLWRFSAVSEEMRLLSLQPRLNGGGGDVSSDYSEVKALSSDHRFVIAWHSPRGIIETGLPTRPLEKMAEGFAYGVQRDTFSGPVSEQESQNCGVFERFEGK